MDIFLYTKEELDALKRKDRKMAVVIDDIGMIERETNPDLFSALISSIVSQQISNRAAETVSQRLHEKLGGITRRSVFEAAAEDIQSCGMSMRKASYIKGIGEAVMDGSLDLEALSGMDDDEVIRMLSWLNGIGVWTAEMMLIFSLGRKNVLSWGDLAIRRGICRLYGHKELSKERFNIYKRRYSPYGSIASLYLWELSK